MVDAELRVLLALTFLTFGVGLVQKDWCRDHAWSAPGVYTHACYSDIPPLYYGRGLAAGDVPYIGQQPDQQVEYPVLTGMAMWLSAKLVPSSDDAAKRTRWYFDINALGLALAAGVAVAATALLAGRRPWDAAIVAVAPTLILAATINWDLLAMALTAVAMLAWARRSPIAAGILLGLGIAAKLYRLFVLGPLLVLCVRADRMRAFLQTLARDRRGVGRRQSCRSPRSDTRGGAKFYRFNVDRAAEFGSPWYALEQLGRRLTRRGAELAPTLLFVAACGAIAGLGLTAQRRPRLPQLVFLVVAAFL